MAITAFLSRSPGLLNRGPEGPASLGHVPHSSIFSPTDWTSGAPSYIIIWHPIFILRASQFCTQFNPSTVKVISWYSSTGCTCYLHRCVSYFDSLAGVRMLHFPFFFYFTIVFLHDFSVLSFNSSLMLFEILLCCPSFSSTKTSFISIEEISWTSKLFIYLHQVIILSCAVS